MLTSEQFENDSNVFNSKKSSPRCPLIFHDEKSFPKVKNIFYAIEVRDHDCYAIKIK